MPMLFYLGFVFGKGNTEYYISDDEEKKRYSGLGRLLVKNTYKRISNDSEEA